MPLPPVRGPRRVPHVVPEKIRPQPWFVYDNADRPDQGPPPSANWQTDPAGFGAGGFTVTSNVFAPTSAGDNQMKWIPDTFGPYCDVSIDVPVLPGAGNFSEIELFDVFPLGTSNGYQITNQLGSGTDLYRSDAGVGTSIAHTATDLAAGSTLRIRITPTAVEGWIKTAGTWTNILIASDTTYRTAFSVGIYQNTTTGRYDNFIATNGLLDDVVAAAGASYVDSGTIPITIALSGADQVASADSGTIPVTTALTGADQVSSTDSGTIATGTVTLSGVDSQGANDTGTIATGTVTITGADQVASTDAGSIPLTITISGADRVASTDAGTIPLTISLSGADLAIYGETGQIPLTISASGADQVASTDSGQITLTITLSGTEQFGAFTGPGFDDIVDRRTNRVLPVP